jgi:hypothetical protein
MDVLKEMRDKHGPRFTNRVNVDLHSGGGWSPEYWTQAAVSLALQLDSLSSYHGPPLLPKARLCACCVTTLANLSTDARNNCQTYTPPPLST